MDEFIRTFIAIEPDPDSKERILKFISDLKRQTRADVRWTNKENLHFTLKFIGEISPQRMAKVIDILHLIQEIHNPFYVSVSGVGFFPDRFRPRIIWVGVREGKEQMINLAKDIEERLESEGFSREKREFTAHLTIGRIRSPSFSPNHIITQEFADRDICRFTADRIILYKSDLQASGPIYSVINDFYLKKV